MAITIRQVGPCFAGEVDGLDLARPLTPEDAAAIHAGMDRYAVLVFHGRPVTPEQHMAFTLALGAIENAVGTGLRENVPPAHRVRRRVQSRQGRAGVRAGQPDAALRARQPPLALRQLVQADPREVLPAARLPHPVAGRQHRVRGHARGLGRPRRGDPGRVRGADLRALAALLAPDPRLHRLHRRGARALRPGAPGAGAHPPGDAGASRSTSRHTPAASSAGRCRRRAPSCATWSSTPPSGSSSTRTGGRSATS